MTGPVIIFDQWRNGIRAVHQPGGSTWTFTLETNRPLPPFTAVELHADNRRKRPSLSSLIIILTRLRSGFRVGVHLFVYYHRVLMASHSVRDGAEPSDPRAD